ncbi:MAG: hypothetical protein COA82_09460 [Alkaliphilus sp.]|nr:hypothetical protein [Alkaliphilus transvaalensis]PHS32317.1 MAG: hypothetical protein COA82_09460 [Alkaliphilus sp.]
MKIRTKMSLSFLIIIMALVGMFLINVTKLQEIENTITMRSDNYEELIFLEQKRIDHTEVGDSSQKLSEVADEADKRTEKMCFATQEIASGMEETSASIEEINATGNQILVLSNTLLEESKYGTEYAI